MEEFKISLSLEEVNLILGSLSELPYKVVNQLLSKITTQAEAQISAKQIQTTKDDVSEKN